MATSIISRLKAVVDRFSRILASGDFSEYDEEILLPKWQSQLNDLSSLPGKFETISFPGFSLEYLLRDSTQLELHLHWLIDGLENLIDALSNLLNNTLIFQANESRPHGPSENSGLQKPAHTEFESILKGLYHTTTSLNQLLSIISYPIPNSRLAGVSQTYIASFESADRAYVRSSFPNAGNGLVDRLGTAISKRRAFLKFWSDNKANRSKVASSTGCHGASTRINCKTFPQPPPLRVGEVIAECPYCHFLITADHDWIKHVVHDVVPYICVARDCATPSRLYTDLDEWHLHLIMTHDTEFPLNASFGCPLCLEMIDEDTSKGHIAGHLEFLAMHAFSDLNTDRDAEPLTEAQRHEILLTMMKRMGRQRDSSEEREEGECAKSSGSEESPNNKRCGETGEPGSQERLKQGFFHPKKDSFNEAARRLISMQVGNLHDASSEDVESRACVDENQHQSSSGNDYTNSTQEPKSNVNYKGAEEITGLSNLEIYGPSRKVNERATGDHDSIQTLSNEGCIFKCDLCYRIFDSEFGADTHSIEEGHLYFVEITQSMIPQRQESFQDNSTPRSESPILSVETKAFRKKLWDDYPEKLQDLKSPDNIMNEQRLWDIAEMADRSAIQILESSLSNHEISLRRMSSLALVLQKQGKLSEATSIYSKLLDRYDATGESSSLAAFEAMHQFSCLLHEEDDYMNAERISRRSLAGIERIKGISDEMTLLAVQNLAQILESQLKLEEAEALFHRAWKGRKEILGSDNLETIESLERLAICLQRRGHYCLAEKLLREALDGYECSFGMNDPKTLQCVFNISRVLHQQEKYQEAKDLYQRVKAERAELFKDDTESSLVAIFEAGVKLRHDGKLRASENMHRRAAEGFERLLGRNHNSTLGCLNGIAVTLRLQGRLREAVKLLLEVAEGKEKGYGRHHPETHKSYLNLANVYFSMGKALTSEMLQRRELELLRQSQGRDSPITLSALINLTSSIGSQGRGREAMDLLQDELEFFKQLDGRSKYGPEEPSRYSVMITMLNAQMDQVTERTGEGRR